jgi:hypothetical protein
MKYETDGNAKPVHQQSHPFHLAMPEDLRRAIEIAQELEKQPINIGLFLKMCAIDRMQSIFRKHGKRVPNIELRPQGKNIRRR